MERLMRYKAGLSQQSCLDLVQHTLPALVHFDDRVLVVPLDRPVRRIRIQLPNEAVLKLRGIELQSKVPLDYKRARFTMSPRAEGSVEPEVALQRPIGIATSLVPFPFWQVEFRSPQAIDSVSIRNQRGQLSVKNAFIQVEYEDAHGVSYVYDNMHPALLLDRAEGFLKDVDGLLMGCDRLGPDVEARPLLERIAIGATTLHDTLKNGLLGDAMVPDLMQADAVRRELIGDILAVIDAATVKRLPDVLKATAPVLEHLLYRGPDKSMPNGSEDETRAVAAIYADEFLRKLHVKNTKLRENARFTQTPERVAIVDHYVESTYLKVTHDAALSPIMIRSHGLSGALLHQHAPKYVGSIREISAIFEGLGYEFAICYGTFLGAFRDKRFIPHDDDVDTVILMKSRTLPDSLEEMATIVKTLRARGMTIDLTQNGFMKMRAPKEGKRMDIFPVVDTQDGLVHMHMQQLRVRAVPRAVVLPFSTIQFYGETFRCPADAIGFLEERYGSTWSTPLRQVGAKTVVAGPTVDLSLEAMDGEKAA
jgi:hypothetical protein